MTAEGLVIVDGQTYNKGDEIPDMGSLECVAVSGNRREYRGLSADVDKLPTYDNLASGSGCLMVDTTDWYEYLAADKKWYKL